jgi:hypothetical protein
MQEMKTKSKNKADKKPKMNRENIKQAKRLTENQ